MKKTYIIPTIEQVKIEVKHGILVEGSLNISGNSGSATFHDSDATGDAMSKGASSYSVWDDDWSE